MEQRRVAFGLVTTANGRPRLNPNLKEVLPEIKAMLKDSHIATLSDDELHDLGLMHRRKSAS